MTSYHTESVCAPVRACSSAIHIIDMAIVELGVLPDLPAGVRKDAIAGLQDIISGLVHEREKAAEDARDSLPPISEDPNKRELEGVRETLAALNRWAAAGCSTEHEDYRRLRQMHGGAE